MTSTITKLRSSRRLIVVGLLALALYVLLPQLGDFRQSLGLLRHPIWQLVLLAGCLSVLTYVAAAGTYYLLAFERLSYSRTLLVQFAAMFINRLLPAGVGSLGVNYAYLHHSRHTKTQAATVVAVNNSLGFIGHIVLSVILLAIFHSQLPPLHFRLSGNDGIWIWRIAVLVTITLIILAVRYRQKLWQVAASVWQQLLYYRRQPRQLVGALLTSMSLTLSNIASLWICLLALHGSLSFIAVLVVFTFGISLGTAAPTPGGLGGVEAGLVAGFVAYHVSTPTALATALLYRLISYWLALVAGALAFIICQRRGYLGLVQK